MKFVNFETEKPCEITENETALKLLYLINLMGYKRFIAMSNQIIAGSDVAIIAAEFNRSKQMIYNYRKLFYQEVFVLKNSSKEIIRFVEEQGFKKNYKFIKNDYSVIDEKNSDYEMLKANNLNNF